MIPTGFSVPKTDGPQPLPLSSPRADASLVSATAAAFSSVLDTLRTEINAAGSKPSGGPKDEDPDAAPEEIASAEIDGDAVKAETDEEVASTEDLPGERASESGESGPTGLGDDPVALTDVAKTAEIPIKSGDAQDTIQDDPVLSSDFSDNSVAPLGGNVPGLGTGSAKRADTQENSSAFPPTAAAAGLNAVGRGAAGDLATAAARADALPVSVASPDGSQLTGRHIDQTLMPAQRRDHAERVQRSGHMWVASSGDSRAPSGAQPSNDRGGGAAAPLPAAALSQSMAAKGPDTPYDWSVRSIAAGSDSAASRGQNAAVPMAFAGQATQIRSVPASIASIVPTAGLSGLASIRADTRSVAGSERVRGEPVPIQLESRVSSLPATAQFASPSVGLSGSGPGLAGRPIVPPALNASAAQFNPMMSSDEGVGLESGSARSDIGAAQGSSQPTSVFGQAIRGAQAHMPPPSAQIAQAVRTQNAGVIEVSLSPEELGTVRISLQRGDGAMQIAIFAERDETMSLLRRHIDDLDAAFRELDLGQVDISFGQGEGDNGHASSAGDTDNARSPRPAMDDTDPRNDLRPAARMALGSRLDLKL